MYYIIAGGRNLPRWHLTNEVPECARQILRYNRLSEMYPMVTVRKLFIGGPAFAIARKLILRPNFMGPMQYIIKMLISCKCTTINIF